MNDAAKSGKHVIILGAGASKESGYPLANDLRMLMIVPNRLHAWLKAHVSEEIKFGQVVELISPFAKTLELFADGAYSSVDEFGKLAHGNMQKEVQELKRLMCFILGLVNPQTAFGSPYFALANALFKKDSPTLRDDVAILTFNYDPHLEYTVARARSVRVSAAGRPDSPFVPTSAILSGFHSEPVRWHEADGFFIGKLHGTIATEVPPVPCEKLLTFGHVFRSPPIQRLHDMGERTLRSDCLPVAFPWELMDENGFIVPEDKCTWNCHVPGVGSLHDVMQRIWGRAVREIEIATTVSFVGLSMHDYLIPAFTRLFKRKRGPVKVVIANPDIREMAPRLFDRGEFHPRCSLRKIRACLQEVAPEMQVVNAPHYLSFESFVAGEVAQ